MTQQAVDIVVEAMSSVWFLNCVLLKNVNCL